ncbi:MAG: S8 family peptidase, partial [Gemmatimonadaceae bacterium]|nr:S8 family peptidase [Gemmatimonadaceae bacterium]
MKWSPRNSRNAAGYRYFVFAAAAFGFAACRDLAGPAVVESPSSIPVLFGQDPEKGKLIPDQYIVVFKDHVADVRGSAEALVQAKGGELHHTYESGIKGFSGKMTAAAAASLKNHPDVAYVEQDQRVSMTGTQSGATWGLDRVDQANLPLNGTYSYATTGSGVNAYIIDTGVLTTHVEFGGRAFGGFDAIGDGYGPTGCHWHGTHVAGTVGGSTVGVAKDVRIYSVRVLDCAGSGTNSGVIAGIDWVTANRVLPAVANMSLGGGYSQATNDALQRSVNAGVTYVVAAGNSTADACSYSPSSAPSALTIGATTSLDAQATYSNFGSCVDLNAPGTAIYSATNTNNTAMGTSSGTSMASPHVAGSAALYLETNPGASPATVASAVIDLATPGVLSGIVGGSPNKLLRTPLEGGAPPPPPPPPPP